MVKRRRSYTKNGKITGPKTSRKRSRKRRRSRNFGKNFLWDKLFKKVPDKPVEPKPAPANISDAIEPIIPKKWKTYWNQIKDYVNKGVDTFIIPSVDDKNFTIKQRFFKWFITTDLGKKY